MQFKDIILTHNKSIVNSREECNTTAKLGKYTFKYPVMCSNMKSVITWDICKLFDDNNLMYVYKRTEGPQDVLNFAKWANKNLNITSISVGIQKEWITLVELLYYNGIKIDYFTVDVALSYNDNITPILEKIRLYYPNSFVICGNGNTSEWLKWISELKSSTGLRLVHAVKFNIGVSKACRTKENTGFSNNIVNTILKLSETNKNLKNKLILITDGGLTVEDDEIWIGDIAKALILGADWIMSGSIYSRCTDSPAIDNGYFGNASEVAKGHKKNIEGATIKVNSNDRTIQEQINLIHESIQSSISYAGGKNLSCLNIDNVKVEKIN